MSKISRAGELLKAAASTMKSGVKGAASQAGNVFKAGAAASEAKGKNIVADKVLDAAQKTAARASAKAVTGDAFRRGIKSGIRAMGESTSKNVTTGTLKRAAGRLTDSDYVSTAIKPGLISAFEQAGGRSGMAKRIVGGAALGGATTGTIGALRGEDFWESSKKGAVVGATAGAGRQVQQMGRTEVGSELIGSMRGQISKARTEANVAQGMKEARAIPELANLSGDVREGVISELASRRAQGYQSKSFMDNAVADIKAAKDSRMEVFNESMANAEARGNQEYQNMKAKVQKRKASSIDIPTRKEMNASRQGKSNQVSVLERANRHANMSNAVLGNHQGGRRQTGVRPRMR